MFSLDLRDLVADFLLPRYSIVPSYIADRSRIGWIFLLTRSSVRVKFSEKKKRGKKKEKNVKEFRSTFHSRSERIRRCGQIFSIFRYFAIIILCTYEKNNGVAENSLRSNIDSQCVHLHRIIETRSLLGDFSLSFLILIWRWASIAGFFFFFFFLWGQVECISRGGKCQGLRDPGSCTRFDYGRFFACFLSLLMRRKLMPTGTEAVEMSNFYCVLLRCSVAGMWEVLN